MKILKQAAKHIITGGVADVADILFFQIFFVLMQLDILAKAISFLVAVTIKYGGNKYWAFEKTERDNLKKEIFVFFLATLVGLLINVASFSFFVNIKTSFPTDIWRLASVVLAMIITALWNFPAYKFLVFKK